MNNLRELTERVKNLRGQQAALKAERDRRMAEWEKQNQIFLKDLKWAIDDLTQAETELRSVALLVYHETGQRKPGQGLEIKDFTVLEYAPKQALAWAIKREIALKLDMPAFEKLAKATQLDFVVYSAEPRCTIATDLAKALEKGDADGVA